MNKIKIVADHFNSVDGRILKFLEEVFCEKPSDNDGEYKLSVTEEGCLLYMDGILVANTADILNKIVSYVRNNGASCDFYLVTALVCQDNVDLLESIIRDSNSE